MKDNSPSTALTDADTTFGSLSRPTEPKPALESDTLVFADADTDFQQRLPSKRLLAKQDKAALRKLHREISSSQDKLFFIRRRGTYGPASNREWMLAQVDFDETDPVAAKDFAVYRMRLFAPTTLDSTHKILAECRYWPLLRQYNDNGVPGKLHQVKPVKVVRQHLSQQAAVDFCTIDVALGEDRLVGPFDFTFVRVTEGPRRKVTQVPYRIDEIYWEALERIGPRRDVDVSNVRRVCPNHILADG